MNTDTHVRPMMVRRNDGPCQCYTSYPTPDQFTEGFTSDHFARALGQKNNVLAARARSLSLGVSLATNEGKRDCSRAGYQTPQHPAQHLQYLSREADLLAHFLGCKQTVSHLLLDTHNQPCWTMEQTCTLMSTLRKSFHFVPGGEYEVDASAEWVDGDGMAALAHMGFNRLRLGLGYAAREDFGAQVAQAQKVTLAARQQAFDSVLVNLCLPLTLSPSKSLQQDLQHIFKLRPDRIAVDLQDWGVSGGDFGGAQSGHCLSARASCMSMRLWSHAQLIAAGYVHVGLNLFALPEDSLAVARRQGRLHRSFLGYGTQPDGDLLGLGVAAKGHVGLVYHQNAPTFEAYAHLLDHDRLPTVRGLALTRDDLVRRSVIMALLCHGEVQFESIELGFMLEFQRYFAREIQDLQALQEAGWVHLDASGIHVAHQDWSATRMVAMVFDRYLQTVHNPARSSGIH